MKNLNLLINRTEGSVCEAQSSVQVNPRESSTQARQNPDKTSVKPCVLSRIGSLMSRQWKVVASIMLLMILGVGEMWADYGLYGCWFSYSYSGTTGNNDDYKAEDNKNTALGTLTADFIVTSVYLKAWDNDGQNLSNAQLCYTINDWTSTSYAGVDNWTKGSKDGNNYQLEKSSTNWTLASVTDPSGNYSMKYYWQAWSDNRYLNNGGSNYSFTYTILPPALEDDDFTVTPSNYVSGTGTSGDPFIIANNSSCTFTVSADQAHTDANSELWAKFGDGSYSSTLTSGSYAKSASKASVTIKAKFRNDDASLDGTEVTKTIYYQEQPAGITVAAGSHGKVSIDNSSFGTSKVITPITFSTNYNIYAQADDYYEFDSWTKTTNGTNTTLGSSSSASTTVSVSSGAVTTVTANFKETGYTITIVGGTAASTTAKVATTTTATAKAPFGMHFTSWTVPASNFTLVDCTTSDETITFNATAAGTVTANFAQTYAYIEGRFRIWNAARSGDWTYTATDNGNWGESSTNIPLTYDNTNHYYYLHTYATPAELSAQLSSNDPWFFIKTSTSSSSWENTAVNRPHASGDAYQQLTTAGDSYKKLADGTSGSNSFKFVSEDASGYVIFAFKEFSSNPYVYYWLEQTLEYDGNESDGGSAPASKTYYDKGTSVQILANSFTKTGYTFVKWNTASNGGGTDKAKDDWLTMNANYTLFAQWSEDKHDVTVEAGDNGAVSTTKVENIGIDTKSGNITATADAGYYFTGWTLPDGITAADGYTSASNPIQINATADSKTITANFAPRWTMPGDSWPEESSWDTESNPFTGYLHTATPARDSGFVSLTLAANTVYSFKLYDVIGDGEKYYGRASAAEDDMYYTDNHYGWALTNASGNNNFRLNTAAAGTYNFTWDLTNKTLSIQYPTSRNITIGQKTIYNPGDSETSDATTTGGNVTAEDNSGNTITTGQYVADAANVTFTAHPETGYAFKGWYSDAACSTPYTHNGTSVVIDNAAKTLTLNSIGTDKAVYAKYEEIMQSISVHGYGGKVSINGGAAVDGTDGSTVPWIEVGVHTTATVSIASENDGYYFAGWEASVASSCGEEPLNFTYTGAGTGEDQRSITITGIGRAGACSLEFLTPQFKNLESIYFRNVFDDGETVTNWENVYAYFDISWVDHSGKEVVQTSNEDIYDKLHVQMEEIGSTHIFRAYVPRFVTRYSKSKVAFSDSEDTYRNSKLWEGNASGRSDYNIKHNMFVPNHVKSYDGNGVAYYNTGYWMHYTISEGANSGYWIERRTAENTYSGKPADQFVIVNRAFDANPKIQYRLRIDGTSDRYYAIFSEGGKKYVATKSITSTACDSVSMVEDTGSDAKFILRPTSEGEYIITIDQSGDSMRISVNYPVSVGDYVLENTYVGGKKKSDPSADSTYVTRSNIIKSIDAATKTRYSMFIGVTSGTLKLRKCTSIDGSGNAVWSTGDATSVASILTAAGSKPGVYQFDLAISGDVASTVDSIRLYTGDYYLKTDAASGGWVAYKNNAMLKNTVNFDRSAATYDNYWCHYFESKDCNIKCVIANDYCNQLSDTIKSDGIARMDGGEPFVPVDGTSIRFSYNSATNTIGRAYLGASSADDFLNIEASTDDKVYKSDGTTDIYDLAATPANRKFTDNGNWVYELDLKVIPGGKAGVKAVYTDASSVEHTQELVPTTTQLLGGTGSSKYTIHLVYDFKTNYFMPTWVPEDEITDKLSDVDLLWVRHKDESATQVTFGTGGALTNVHVVGALEFRYDEMCSSSTSGSKVDLSEWNAVSRPYLKYFISYPFDVEMNSIFGLNEAYYGLDYVIQKYNGTARAKDGLFAGDGDNYWENVQMGDTLFANEGYCVILDNDYARWSSSSDMWYNKVSGNKAYLYFPAMSTVKSISNRDTTTTVAAHECKVDRTWIGSTKNHMQTDSHWNMIGSPLFHDAYIGDTTNGSPYLLSSYYELNYSTNKWEAKAMKDAKMIKAMSSRLVQWYGTITWTTNEASSKYAPRRTPEENDYFAKVELIYNDEVADRTYVEMKDNADADFVLREDMCKFYNKGIPQIYTFAGDYDVAYNGVPVKSQIIPLGVVIRRNGTYTFSMPTDFSGTVTLVDTYAQTRTNLAFDEYEVQLEKGTIDDRFYLEIDLKKVATSLENTEGNNVLNDGGYHKFVRDDKLFILKNGVVYDAQGRKVE